MFNRRTVRRLFLVWEFEKEENWLNEMAMSGWVLVDVGFCRYTFERCEPGEYIVRMEMHNPDDRYISFMQETGAEYIWRIVRWIYFRKKSALGAFEIFQDIDAKIAHLNNIGNMLTGVGIVNLGIGIANSAHSGWINLICATVLMYALGRIHGKKEALIKNRLLHE